MFLQVSTQESQSAWSRQMYENTKALHLSIDVARSFSAGQLILSEKEAQPYVTNFYKDM